MDAIKVINFIKTCSWDIVHRYIPFILRFLNEFGVLNPRLLVANVVIKYWALKDIH